jgi:hypothetical protein
VTADPPEAERYKRSSRPEADFLVGFDLPVTKQNEGRRRAPATDRINRDSNATTRTEPSSDEPELDEPKPRATAFPLYDNVYVLVPNHERLEPEEAAELGLQTSPEELDQFDVPERDRMYGLAMQFVRNHARRVRSGSAVKSRGLSLSDRAIVVSEKRCPRLPFRVAKLSWAVDRNAVVDLHKTKVLSVRLARVDIPPRRYIWGPGRGDSFDLAYLLANVCAILSMHVPEPVAASGVVTSRSGQIVGNDPIEDKRRAASKSRMAHLILPFAAHLMPGFHEGVRYWPVRDVNEAVFSLLSAACSGNAGPNHQRP